MAVDAAAPPIFCNALSLSNDTAGETYFHVPTKSVNSKLDEAVALLTRLPSLLRMSEVEFDEDELVVVVLFDEFLSKFFKENADALPMHNAITRSNDRIFFI